MSQHFQTVWRHIRRVPYQALAAITIMVITFFVATFLAILGYASSRTISYFETRPQIIAFLKDEAAPEDISALQRKLEGDTRAKGIRYVSKEQALDIYKEATADNPVLSEFVSPRVFPSSLEFSVTDLSFAQDLIEEIKKDDIVSKAVFTASLGDGQEVNRVIENLKKVTQYIRIGGGAILVFLLFSSLLTLLVIIGMRISTRKDEIEILRLLGATSGFIRMPFVIEGVVYTTAGAFFGWLSGSLLVLYASPSLATYFGEIQVLPRETDQLLILLAGILGGELIFAFFLGLAGSMVALGRYLKK